MIDGITVRMLGDYGPFSRVGKSIGYQVSIGESNILVDCGAPLFQKIGGHGLKTVKGLIITHCHDDHKRWFSDLALFNMYAPDVTHRVSLITSEDVDEGLRLSSATALETSLSPDSLRVMDIAYEEYIDFRLIGPRAKYRIIRRDLGDGMSRLVVADRDGELLGPERAKIVISSRTGKPRLLFRDPESQEWVEPISYYSFSSTTFYEKEHNIYRNPEGFTIEAFNASVWHGVPGIGLKFSTNKDTLIFSADTNHDVQLWKQLCSERLYRKSSLSEKEFVEASIIYGDINDYIERAWSKERYNDAMNTFRDAAVIHDIATRRSVVHTDYRRIQHTVLEKSLTILTHSPDKMTSEWILGEGDKVFKIKGNEILEVVGDKVYRFNADLYHKEDGRYFVGYRNDKGDVAVYENDGLLNLTPVEIMSKGRLLFRMDLYEDVGGRYFPCSKAGIGEYRLRDDGQVERVKVTAKGSRAEIVTDIRDQIGILVS